MDDARLQAIKARADAATAGPWTAVLLGNGYRDTADQRHAGYWIPEAESLGDGECAAIPEHDALFISHAREDVPDLIAALEASRAECARLRVAAADVLLVYAPVAHHAYVSCFHPTELEGGEGCYSFASCHGDWPATCKLPFEWHTTDPDSPWLAFRAALNGADDATVGSGR